MIVKKVFKPGRLILAFVIVTVVVMIGIFVAYYHEQNSVIKIDSTKIQYGNVSEIKYEVEDISKTKKGILYTGWAIKPGVKNRAFNYGWKKYVDEPYNNVHIGYADKHSIYLLPTKLHVRKDVNEMVADGNDYRYCGFTSLLPNSKEYLENKQMIVVFVDMKGNLTAYDIEK